MRIESVTVSNFRVIGKRVTLNLGDLTALIGSNGTGKTTLLLALEKFFSSKAKRLSLDDLPDKSSELVISVTADVGEGRRIEVACRCRREEKNGKAKLSAPKYHCGGKSASAPAELFGFDVRVLSVPAEHETDDDGEDKKDSILQKLIDDAVRDKMTGDAKEEEKARRTEFQEGYRDELKRAEKVLNQKLGSDGGVGYAPNARVTLDFGEP